jgi:hypothetical protein
MLIQIPAPKEKNEAPNDMKRVAQPFNDDIESNFDVEYQIALQGSVLVNGH